MRACAHMLLYTGPKCGIGTVSSFEKYGQRLSWTLGSSLELLVGEIQQLVDIHGRSVSQRH